jgi:cobalt-zinc-cadmium efflux system membrane fusion protein
MKSFLKIYSAILLLVIFGCKNSESKSTTDIDKNQDNRIVVSKAQFQQNNMMLGSIEEQLFPVSIKVNGIIDVPPENKAIVNSITGGYIKTIPLLVGNTVKKGQIIATIESPEFVSLQQNYMEIKEQLNYLKNEYERQNTMFGENIISEKVFLKTQSQYKTALASYNGLKKQLLLLNISPKSVEQGIITSVINIYAPINGSITKVNVSKGSYVSPSTPILEIIDNSHIHLELSVFEKDIMNIEENQKILFTIPETSGKVYEASVYLVGTSIEENRTIKVHAHPNNESHRFLTGMFVNAEIIIAENKTKALPETTIVEDEDQFFVLVLDEENDINYYFKPLEVNVGLTKNNYTEIKNIDALTKNDKLLLNGAFSLIGNE